MKNHQPAALRSSRPIVSTRARFALPILSLAVLLSALSAPAGVVRTFDGDGAAATGNGAWTNVLNWDGDTTVPADGDALTFNSSFGLFNTNNLPFDLHVDNIVFLAAGYNLFGNPLTITNGLWDATGGNSNNIPLTLGAAQSFTNSGGTLFLNANITNNANNLTVQVDSGMTIGGIIGSGPGSLTKNGGGTLTLNGANTFGGGLAINEGSVVLGNANAIPNGAGVGDVNVGPLGSLDVLGAARNINGLNGSGLVLNGNAAAGTLVVGNNATNSAGTFDGAIQNATGTLGLTKVNTNTLTLNGANTYTGPTLINGGTLVMGPLSSLQTTAITVSPGSVFDVSAVAGGYQLFSGRTLSAGRPSNGPTDINGELGMAGGTLSILNSANPGTLTINGPFTLTGGILNYKLRASTTTAGSGLNDLVSLNGTTLALSTPTIVKPTFIEGSFAGTPYTLVNGAGSISGSTANLSATLPRGLSAAFATGVGTLTVTFSGTPTPGSLIWNLAGGLWDVNISQNWLNGGSPDFFLDLDNVRFNDNAAGTVGLPGAVAPGSVILSNATAYTFNGAGSVGGSGSWTKTGPGTLTFQNGSSHTYTGPTIVNNGIMLADFNNAATPAAQILYGGGATNSLVLGGGTFRISSRANTTVSQIFTSTTVNAGNSVVDQSARQSNGQQATSLGAITRNVGGTLDISPQTNPNAGGADLTGIFTSTATVNGILGGYATFVGNSWATLGNNGQTNLSVFNRNSLAYVHIPTETNATSFTIVTNNVDISTVNNGPITNATVNSVRFNLANRTLTLAGTNTLSSGGLLVTPNAGASQITGGAIRGATNADLVVIQNNPANPFVIASTIVNHGSSALTKGGVGIVQLTANNSYTGATYINSGTLQIGNGGTSGGISNSSAVIDNGNLTFNRSDALGVSLPISGVGSLTKQGASTLFLTGNNTYSGATTISAGTLQIGAGGTSGAISNSTTIANSGSLIFNRSDNLSVDGLISGTGTLTKQGAGRLTLGNTNIYLGGTFISAGTLALGPAASLANSTPIAVSNAATFDVSGPGGLTLNGAFAQTLVGSGTVTGSVTTAAGVLVIPGTSVGTLTFKNDLTLSGGRARFEVAGGSNDIITVNGNLALNSGQVQVIVLGAPLVNGNYKLFNYGTLSGDPNNIPVVGFAQAGQLARLTNEVAGQIDLVIYTGTGANLTWAGDGGANNWDVNTTPNWLGGLVFKNNDNVTFDDSSVNFTVNLVSSLFPGSVLVNTTNSYTFSGAGLVSGGSGLIKNGTGSLTVLTANDYGGQTTVNNGTLQLGNGTTAGRIGDGDVANTGAIVFNEPAGETVVAVPITGSGSVSTIGAGSTLTLTANNAIGGVTSIGTGATLQVGSGGGTGATGNGNIQDDGVLTLNRSGLLSVAGSISGNGSVSLQGGGTYTLNGNNTFTNGLTIAAGSTLNLGSGNSLPEGGTAGLVTVNGVLEMNARDETINGLAGNGNVRNNNGTGTNTLTIGSGDAGTNGVVTLNAVIQNNTGAGGVVAIRKVGAGQFNVGGASTYSGGTLLLGGAIRAGANAAFGVGPITLDGGQIRMNNGRVLANTLIVTNTGGEIFAEANSEWNGPIQGGADQVLRMNMNNAAGTTLSLDGGMNSSTFTGTILGTNGAGSWRLNGFNAGGLMTFDLQGTMTLFPRNGGQAIRIGAVQGGASGGSLAGANTVDGLTTFIIGDKGSNAVFAGPIANGNTAARLTAVVKSGPATQTFSGALTYSGNTTVSNGVLSLIGTTVIPNSSPVVSLVSPGRLELSGATLNIGGAAAQTIVGSGTLGGALTTAANGSVAPGLAGIGTLTVSNSTTLAGIVNMEVNPTNAPANNADRLTVQTGTLTYGGTLNVTNIGTLNVTNGTYSFQLFSAPVIAGTFAATNLPALPPNKSWDTSQLNAGILKLVVAVNANPSNLVATVVGGNQLQLNWAQNQIGWRLQVQTNSLAVGLRTNWTFVAGSDATNQMTFPIGTTGCTFYRMVFP
jgi:fibronectin-binding autotransporter adhesin